MLVPWRFAVASVAIGFIKIVFSGTIGAILVYYNRLSNDSYANSIRWSRNGGLFEMVVLLKNSWKILPRESRIAMTSVISAQIFALLLPILLGAFVYRADRFTNVSPSVAVTGQQPATELFLWTDWTAFMESDATMEDTLVRLLNSTRFNPNSNPDAIYTPRKYDYVVPCNETGVLLIIISTDSPTQYPFMYPSPHDNCAVLVATLENGNGVYTLDVETATNQLASAGEYIVVAPIAFSDTLWDVVPDFTASNGHMCELPTFGMERYGQLPEDGIVALPITSTVRCQYNTSDSFIMGSTFTKFAVNHLKDFSNVTTLVFDDPSKLPLLQSMSIAINNGTFLNPSNNATAAILIKISDNVDFLSCASFYFNLTNNMGLVCTYVMTALISTEPQQWDPLTPTTFRDATSPPSAVLDVSFTNVTNQNEFTIYHMPSGLNEVISPYSVSHLLKATTDTTLYLASLGHNVVVNPQTEQLCVVYDTVELRDAFEVPLGLVIFLIVATIICLVFWYCSERYTPVFNGSFYKIIYQRVLLEEEEKGMLMDCTHDPLSFEGYKVILDFDGNLAGSSQEDVADNWSNQSQTSHSALLMELVPLQVAHSPVISPPAPSPIPTCPAVASSGSSYSYAGSTFSSGQAIGQGHSPPIPPRPPMINGVYSHAFTTNSANRSLQSVSSPATRKMSTLSSLPPRPIPLPQSVTLIDSPFD